MSDAPKLSDAEWRRRAYAFLSRPMTVGVDRAEEEAHAAEHLALLAAGPTELRSGEVDVPGVSRPVRYVELARVRFICPKCGPGVATSDDWTCATCGADVFREDVSWLRTLVAERDAERRGSPVKAARALLDTWEQLEGIENLVDTDAEPGDVRFTPLFVARLDEVLGQLVRARKGERARAVALVLGQVARCEALGLPKAAEVLGKIAASIESEDA